MIEAEIWGPETGIEAREEVLRRIRQDLKSQAEPEPQVIVATCDRVEIYSGDGAADEETARGLFALAAGLRSPLLGENAIIGQVKRAYSNARSGHVAQCLDCYEKAGMAAPVVPTIGMSRLNKGLDRLFQAALACGKKVRSRTGISRGAVGHGQAAMQILAEEFGSDLSSRRVLIVGVNKLVADVLVYLQRHGVANCCIINRGIPKAQALAARFGYRSAGFEALPEEIAGADAVISATSAPHALIKAAVHRPRTGAVLVDLAIPRDFDAALAADPAYRYFDVHAVEARTDQALDARAGELAKAWEIVNREVRVYMERQRVGEALAVR